MSKVAIILNQSRRLHVIGGVRILPTEAREVPEEVIKSDAFLSMQEKGELAIVTETRDPILDEDEARKEAERRKKEGLQANNGAPVKTSKASGRARSTGEGQGEN